MADVSKLLPAILIETPSVTPKTRLAAFMPSGIVAVTVLVSGDRTNPPAISVSDRLTQLVASVTESSTSTGPACSERTTVNSEPPPEVVKVPEANSS